MVNPLLLSLPDSITTPHLHLRLPTPADAPAILKAAKETHSGLNAFYGGTLTQKNLTLSDVQGYLQSCLADFHNRIFLQYGVFDAKSGGFIGMASLHHLDWTVPKGHIGYWVRKSQEGKGYATEIAHILTSMSFTKLKLERLEIRTATINPASSAIPKKLGYALAGILAKNKRGADGTLWDLEVYDRLNAKGLPKLSITYS